MKTLRFLHTDDLSDLASFTEVFPLSKKEFQDKIDKNEVFYRRKSSGKYKFVNEFSKGISDYDFFIKFENDIDERCKVRFIVVEELCLGEWIEIHVGKFTMNDGDYNLDRCELEVKVKEVDSYSCIKETKGVEFNVLSVAPVISTTAPQSSPYEFLECRSFSLPCGPVTDCYSGPNPTRWTNFHEECSDIINGTGNVIYNSGNRSLECSLSETHAAHLRGNNNERIKLVTLSNGNSQVIGTNLGFGNIFDLSSDYLVYTDKSPTIRVKLYNILLGTTIVIDNSISNSGFGYQHLSIRGDYVVMYDDSGAVGRRLLIYKISAGTTTIIWSDISAFGINSSTITHEDGFIGYYDSDNEDYFSYEISSNTQNIIVNTSTNPQFIKHFGIYVTYYNSFSNEVQSYNTNSNSLTIVKVGVTSIFRASGNIKYYVFLNGTGVNSLEYYEMQTDTLSNTGIVAPNIQGIFSLDNNDDYIVFYDSTTNNASHFEIATSIKTDFASNGAGNTIRLTVNDFNTILYQNPDGNDLLDYNIERGTSILTEPSFQSVFSFCKNKSGQFMATTAGPNDIQIWNGTRFNSLKIRIWYREVRTTICVGGNPQQPAGTGWLLEEDNCSQNGTAMWVRNPNPPVVNPTIQITDCICENGSCFPLAPVGAGQWLLVARCDINDPRAFYWLLPSDVSYSNGRLLKDAIEGMIAKNCPEINGIKSDFFQWNPDSPTLVNYVTNEVTEVNFISIHQNSDMKNPLSFIRASIGLLKWSDLVKMLRVMFEVYWFIDNNNVLNFEHISRVQENIGLDLTQGKFNKWQKNNRKYSYSKSEMFMSERFKMQEQENIDFVGFPIEYKDINGDFSLCVNDQDQEYSVSKFSADLALVQNSPDVIENNGFYLLANTFDLVNYSVIIQTGFISNQLTVNSTLSWANLMEAFLKWNRILSEGNVNSIFQKMKSFKRFKKQAEFIIPICCDDDYTPEDFVKTDLGIGQVESASRDFKTNTLKLKLKYQ